MVVGFTESFFNYIMNKLNKCERCEIIKYIDESFKNNWCRTKIYTKQELDNMKCCILCINKDAGIDMEKYDLR